MGKYSLVANLKRLEADVEQLNINYKGFSTYSDNTNTFMVEMENQINSNSIEDQIKGLSKQIAFSNNNDNVKSIISGPLHDACTNEITSYRTYVSEIPILRSILFSVGFVVLSILCFALGVFLISRGMNRFGSGFLRFIIHLLIYVITFIPVYIWSYYSPHNKIFLGIITLVENLFMIFFVNPLVSDRISDLTLYGYTFGYLIGLILILLLVFIPAIAVACGYFYLCWDEWYY